MVLQKAESIVKTMLSDTILALCRNTLPYEGEFCVEGLIGITLDSKEIFLVHLNETIQKEGFIADKAKDVEKSTKRRNESEESDEGSSQYDSDNSQNESTRKKRKRKRHRKKEKIESLEKLEQSEEERDSVNDNVQSYENVDQETPSVGVDQNRVDNDRTESKNHSHDKNTYPVKIERVGYEDEDSGDVVYVKEEPRDDSFDLSQFSQSEGALQTDLLRIQGSQSGDSSQGYNQGESSSFGQLQHLAMQLSSDLNAGATQSPMVRTGT